MADFFHKAKFDHFVNGQMSDCELLGLPDHFVEVRPPAGPEQYKALASATSVELVEILENPRAPAAERLAAGQMLALKGDPRLNVTEPEMIDVKGGDVDIGLAKVDLPRVMASFSGLGVDPQWIVKELPRHSVTLPDYRIGRYPVTNFEYREFLLDTGDCELPTSWRFRQFPYAKSNCPVHTVTSEAAKRYCALLSEKTGRCFRLPSEAEWEFAAAGPEGLEFPWGNTLDADRANIAEEGYLQATPVGCFPAGQSWCGALDMAGNVEEFTNDLCTPYPGGEYIFDDLHETLNTYQVARGGSYTRFFDLARTRRRHGHYQKEIYVMGFRLAEDLN